MEKKILFRADGNPLIGLGHLYRLFALVDMLKPTYDFCFVTRDSSMTEVIPVIYDVRLIPSNIPVVSEPEWLAMHFKPSNYFIVADGYQFDSNYQLDLKKLDYLVVYVDDLVLSHMYADIVINHAPNLNREDFSCEKYTKFGLGISFSLLRQTFLARARLARKIERMDTLFVCFGGADKFDLSSKTVEAAMSIDSIKHIHVVLGGANSNRKIYDIEKKYPDKVITYRNLSENELIALMNSCNIGVAPTSTIFYELCCIKMPILGGYFVDNQRKIYEAMVKNRVLIGGGDFTEYTTDDFATKLKKVLDHKKPMEYIQRQQALFDGRSGQRILGLINSLNVTFRKVNEQDVNRTFEWSNDELVRSNSYSTEKITLKNHIDWFNKKLANKNTLFLIAEVNKKPAGLIRYEILTDHAVIGILVQNEFRGQGLASDFLLKSATLYFSEHDRPIFAFIKKENKASLKSFEKSGYRLVDEKKIKGIESFIYKLEQKDER